MADTSLIQDSSLIESKIGLLIWKTSNFWQSKLRKILSSFGISLNEYLILMAASHLLQKYSSVYQNQLSKFVGINISVVSVNLKLLEQKRYVIRSLQNDNRKKTIKILKEGEELYRIIHPLVKIEEDRLFNKLNNETFNFTNSLKLLLGKKIRIKANIENK